ncbi:hypothetical protein HYX70_01990 [Candidatus Saccharibacteria bacterium]|nr:hypothetical protein [Candidatus Saccharibacteria bacterium]
MSRNKKSSKFLIVLVLIVAVAVVVIYLVAKAMSSNTDCQQKLKDVQALSQNGSAVSCQN